MALKYVNKNDSVAFKDIQFILDAFFHGVNCVWSTNTVKILSGRPSLILNYYTISILRVVMRWGK